jgi:DNA-binding protein H-NS
MEKGIMKRIGLASMNFDQLVELRDTVESMIQKRASDERRALQDKLDQLSKFAGGGGASKGAQRGSSLKGRKVPPKYRNPDDSSQTWAGRGATPRWLASLLAKGRKLEDFAIEAVRGKRGRPKKRA